MNVPKLRFKEFNDESYRKDILKNIISYIADNRGKNPDYYLDSGIPVIDNFMIQNQGYPDLSRANRYIDNNIYENFIRKAIEYNDTLITLVGNGIGNICLTPKEKCVIIQNTLGLRTNKFNDKKYLYHLLTYKNSEIKKLDRGMAQPSIRQDELLKLEVTIPNINEQHKISNFLSLLDKKIELQSKKIEGLKLFKLYIRKKIFSSNTNNNIRLKEIVNCESSNITLADIENDNGIYPVYGATGFIKNIKNYNFDSEYIAIVKDGAGVGRTMICPKNSSILATMNALTIKNNYPLNYICEMINTISFDKYIVGSGIPHIYFKDYGNEEFMLHNENDANKFDSVFKCLDRKIELLNVSLDKLNILKKGLMQGMFV